MIFHYYLRLPVLLLRNNSKRIIVIRPVLYVYMNNLYTYTCIIIYTYKYILIIYLYFFYLYLYFYKYIEIHI